MIRKLAFVVYPALKDFAKTRNFYTHVLHMAEGLLHQDNDSETPWSWLEYDLPHGGCFALTDMAGTDSQPACGVAFEVDSIEDILSKLPSHAIKTHMFDTGVCSMAKILDPEGNTVILHKIGKHRQ